MIEQSLQQVLQVLERQHIVLCGRDAAARQAILVAVSNEAKSRAGRLYQLQAALKTPEKFLKAVRETLPLQPLLSGQLVRDLSLDQVADIWLDWVLERDDVLLICPELGLLSTKFTSHFYQYLGDVLTLSHKLAAARATGRFRTIFTLPKRPDGFYEQIPLFIGQEPARAKASSDLARHYFKVLEL